MQREQKIHGAIRLIDYSIRFSAGRTMAAAGHFSFLRTRQYLDQQRPSAVSSTFYGGTSRDRTTSAGDRSSDDDVWSTDDEVTNSIRDFVRKHRRILRGNLYKEVKRFARNSSELLSAIVSFRHSTDPMCLSTLDPAKRENEVDNKKLRGYSYEEAIWASHGTFSAVAATATIGPREPPSMIDIMNKCRKQC